MSPSLAADPSVYIFLAGIGLFVVVAIALQVWGLSAHFVWASRVRRLLEQEGFSVRHMERRWFTKGPFPDLRRPGTKFHREWLVRVVADDREHRPRSGWVRWRRKWPWEAADRWAVRWDEEPWSGQWDGSAARRGLSSRVFLPLVLIPALGGALAAVFVVGNIVQFRSRVTPGGTRPVVEPNAGSAAPPTVFEIRCRGGGDAYRIAHRASGLRKGPEGESKVVVLSVDFRAGRLAAGSDGAGLAPGTCAWIDRPLSDQEPRVIHFETSAVSSTGAPHIMSPAPGTFPGNDELRDPTLFWRFIAFNTNQGFLQATSHGPWRPPEGDLLPVDAGPAIEREANPAGAWTGPPGAATPVIPLCAGLAVVTAVASQGDYESIKTVESISPDAVRIKYSSESSPPWWSPFRAQLNKLVTHRTVLKADLESAHSYAQIFVGATNAPETAPGTTAIGTSAAVLRELKTTGESELSLCHFADDAAVMRDGRLHKVPAGCHNFSEPFPLDRVGTARVPQRVLVDGTPTDLPAVQARGQSASGEKVEFFFLDDERNPLTLAFRLGIGEMPALDPETRRLCETEGKKGGIILQGLSCDLPDGGDRDTLRVIKISTRCELAAVIASSGGGAGPGSGGATGSGAAAGGGAQALEQALAEKGSVDVYSIYFSFNSDVLREESESTLVDIATVLGRHPSWKLRVNGHTDGIGADGFNLDLSRRRAAAVKDALTRRHGVSPDRLDTDGHGESQPKDTNDTIEGRARNRRVELVRGGA